MGLKNIVKRFYIEYIKGEQIWDFCCRDCHEVISVKRSGVPIEAQTGEKNLECPKCGGVLSKPLHVVRPWED